MEAGLERLACTCDGWRKTSHHKENISLEPELVNNVRNIIGLKCVDCFVRGVTFEVLTKPVHPSLETNEQYSSYSLSLEWEDSSSW